MKRPIYIFIIIIGLISACTESKQNNSKEKCWSKQEILNYFQDSIAYRMYNGRYGEGKGLNDFTVFSDSFLKYTKSKNYNDPMIFALEEEYIDSSNISPSFNWFRIVTNPTFIKPYSITLVKKNNKSYLTTKQTDGTGGYFSGYLTKSLTLVSSDSLFNQIANQLDSINIWEINVDTTCLSGTDGDQWTIEFIKDGKYCFLSRWEPLNCGDSNTKLIGKIGLSLLEKSGWFEERHKSIEYNE